MLIRYSRWDGSQAVPDLDADDLLSAMSDDLMLDGDPWRALRRLFQQGLQHPRSEEHTSELQSQSNLVCRLLLEKKKKKKNKKILEQMSNEESSTMVLH